MDYSKEALRDYFSKKRLALSHQTHDDYSLAIANLCLKLPIWEFNFFHLFLPIASQAEVDTTLILTLLQGRDKQVVLPRVSGQNRLEHILLTDGTKITQNKWGIPEPESGISIDPSMLEVVFIPLFSFDKKGNRVGYGKGFYDVFLKNCKKEVLKIGLSFFDPVDRIDGIRDEDIPLDYCISPQKIHSF
ncbi:MAG: 5-formyltetrahydrofolate cyclo-ligase [Flavobacteriia bacterium]